MAVGLDLDQYQLKNRVLLVFAPSPEDARYVNQHAYFGEGEDLLDRSEIILFGIFEEGPSFAGDRALSGEDSHRAREDFGVREGEFGLRLMDLDGTEILRSSEPIPVEDLADVVQQKAD